MKKLSKLFNLSLNPVVLLRKLCMFWKFYVCGNNYMIFTFEDIVDYNTVNWFFVLRYWYSTLVYFDRLPRLIYLGFNFFSLIFFFFSFSGSADDQLTVYIHDVSPVKKAISTTTLNCKQIKLHTKACPLQLLQEQYWKKPQRKNLL